MYVGMVSICKRKHEKDLYLVLRQNLKEIPFGSITMTAHLRILHKYVLEL